MVNKPRFKFSTLRTRQVKWAGESLSRAAKPTNNKQRLQQDGQNVNCFAGFRPVFAEAASFDNVFSSAQVKTPADFCLRLAL
jgi:hypothetical protein